MADDGTPLTEPDDELIERLRALGPVLDQLAEEAAGPGGPGGPGTGLRRAPRRRQRQRRRSFVAAAILLLFAGALALSVLARDDSSSITSDQTTTTVADPELAALVATRIDDVKSCGAASPKDQWSGDWPAGWAQVGSHTCRMGWLEAGAEPARPTPVYENPATVGEVPIAYWSPSTGWIDVAEFDDPDFDLAQYRAAYSAELEDRGEDPDRIPDDGTYYADE